MVISREAAFKFHNRRGRGYAFVQVILVFHSPWEGAVFVYVCLAQFSFRALFFFGCNVPASCTRDGRWSDRQLVPDRGDLVLCRYSWELSSDDYIVQEGQPLLS